MRVLFEGEGALDLGPESVGIRTHSRDFSLGPGPAPKIHGTLSVQNSGLQVLAHGACLAASELPLVSQRIIV